VYTTYLEVKIAVLLVLLLILSIPKLRRLLVVLLATGGRGGLAQIGNEAVMKQPSNIRLLRKDGFAWKDPAKIAELSDPLLSRGFSDAGTYAVDAMPGVMVRLLVNPSQSMYACVYEHPKAGNWVELMSAYQDGTTASFSTLPATGLDDRPGSKSVRVPGSNSGALYDRAIKERPQGMLKPVSASSVVSTFEGLYAEAMAWRKNRGVTSAEVAKVALKGAGR
jgi:hypothetical protein